MLRLLRTHSSAALVRQFIATMFAIVAAVTFLEPAIADGCEERDAAANSLVVATIGAANHDGSSTPIKDLEGHAVHLCHCAHAHGLTATNEATPVERPALARIPMRMQSDRLPPSALLDRDLRPPRELNA